MSGIRDAVLCQSVSQKRCLSYLCLFHFLIKVSCFVHLIFVAINRAIGWPRTSVQLADPETVDWATFGHLGICHGRAIALCPDSWVLAINQHRAGGSIISIGIRLVNIISVLVRTTNTVRRTETSIGLNIFAEFCFSSASTLVVALRTKLKCVIYFRSLPRTGHGLRPE